MNGTEDKSYQVTVGYDGLLNGGDPKLNEREAARWQRDLSWVQPAIRAARRREAIIDTLYALGIAIVWAAWVMLILDL